MSGYGFVFPSDQNLVRAQQLRSEVKYAPSWTLGYDADDPLARVVAERIVLNSRDAGIRLQVASSGTSDIRLTRLTLASVNGRVALLAAAASTGLLATKVAGNSVADLYKTEDAMLQTQKVIPLFQLPTSYALSGAVKDWTEDRDGSVHFDSVWLGNKP